MSFFYRPIDKEIYNIALPAFAGFIVFILFDITDVFWIGRAGTDAVAGCSSGGFLAWLIFAAMNVTTVGANSLIAQSFGAKKLKLARRIAHEASWLSLAAAAIIGLLMFFSSSFIFRFMGLEPNTMANASVYINTFLLFYPFYYLSQVFTNVFNAYGDTKTNVSILAAAVVVNMVLDPVLILGYGTGYAMGVKGAVIASGIAEICGLVAQFVYLRRRGYISPLKVLIRIPKLANARKILSIGFPAGCTAVVWSFVYPLMTPIISRFGMEPIAAIRVCFTCEDFPYDIGMGFSIAMAALVGQSYGRGDYAHVRELVRRGCQILTLWLVPFVSCFIFIPEILAGLLNPDPGVVRHAADYLFIVGLGEIFLGWELLFQGSLNGLGLSKSYMYISLPLTLGRLPIAYFLAITMGFGTKGIWATVSATTALKGILLCLTFFRGNAVERKLSGFKQEEIRSLTSDGISDSKPEKDDVQEEEIADNVINWQMEHKGKNKGNKL